ncbi:MAG TPA: fumarylacetoacetate hydrolase family protein [Burkholderiales bacterium]|nr:fumarylacetoacetate hydrolase family protein [Burkholderiales bacterium]
MNIRWCRFRADDTIAHGRIDGEIVIALDGAPWEPHAETSRTYELGAVKLLVPVIPPTFYCVGLNYREHIIASARRRGIEPRFPQRPDVNYRANNALNAHGDPIVKPKDAGELFQYEGELVAVIGRQGRHIEPERALDHVFGYTIGNDVSERTWQRGDRTGWRARNSDTFNPMGPWIVSGADYRKMTTVVRMNGEEVDRFATGAMIHDVETCVAEISKYCTLYPGDVIWMGTDGAPRNMKPGDVCEIEISDIGVLRNPVVAEQ